MSARSRIAKRKMRAFTLVELMVSLVAGMIIAIAVVGLARTATTAFHEQVRLSSVEQNMRSAADRLRLDIARASFMGTGNIQLAAFDANQQANVVIPLGHGVARVIGQSVARYASTKDLAGIRVVPRGSYSAYAAIQALSDGPVNLNNVKPDMLYLSGNFTTDEMYLGHVSSNAGACGGGYQVQLNVLEDPAVGRLVNGATSASDATRFVQNAFTPAPGVRFLARVLDQKLCSHIVEIQDAAATTPGIVQINVCPDAGGRPGILRPTEITAGSGGGATQCGWGGAAPGGGVLGLQGEEVWISPLARVRWFIGPATDATLLTGAQQAALTPVAPGALNEVFLLFRQILDANEQPVPTLPPQIVGEYAVDLKLGVVVDDAAQAPPNNMRVFEMDSDPGTGNIKQWTDLPTATAYNGPGPQRVRAVRYRLAVRASVPDRPAQLTGVPANYIGRYCLGGGPPGDQRCSRVRTIVSEVALVNQQKMTY